MFICILLISSSSLKHDILQHFMNYPIYYRTVKGLRRERSLYFSDCVTICSLEMYIYVTKNYEMQGCRIMVVKTVPATS